MRNNLYIISFLFLLIELGCAPSQIGANKNVAGTYMPELKLPIPSYKVFHVNDTLTKLYFRCKAETILYTKKRGDTTFSANISIYHQLTEENSKTIIDSATLYFNDYGPNGKMTMLDGEIELSTQRDKKYTLQLLFKDLNRDYQIHKKINMDRTNVANSENYLILDSNKNIVFRDYFQTNETIYLKKNISNTAESLIVKFYDTKHPLPLPPFVVNAEDQNDAFFSKSSNSISFNEHELIEYQITEKGLYHFQTSENNKKGPTFYHFQENFPKVLSVENMLAPTRYITSNEEYQSLIKQANKKAALDNFWIKIGGSKDRARDLIKEYYSRVENSNNYFTSYTEGWKTDRGIIYIIFGAPNTVYQNEYNEIWIYGEESNITSMNFLFHKVDNPISNNDYRLKRSIVHKNGWYRAVENWRNGRI